MVIFEFDIMDKLVVGLKMRYRCTIILNLKLADKQGGTYTYTSIIVGWDCLLIHSISQASICDRSTHIGSRDTYLVL